MKLSTALNKLNEIPKTLEEIQTEALERKIKRAIRTQARISNMIGKE